MTTPTVNLVPDEAGAAFSSIYTWPTITIISALALIVVWAGRGKFDVRTGVLIGLAVYVGLSVIILAYAVGYGVGHEAATTAASGALW